MKKLLLTTVCAVVLTAAATVSMASVEPREIYSWRAIEGASASNVLGHAKHKRAKNVPHRSVTGLHIKRVAAMGHNVVHISHDPFAN